MSFADRSGRGTYPSGAADARRVGLPTAGGPGRGLVTEFKGVKVCRDLTLRLTAADPIGPLPVLSGIEIVAEGW